MGKAEDGMRKWFKALSDTSRRIAAAPMPGMNVRAAPSETPDSLGHTRGIDAIAQAEVEGRLR